MSAHAKLSASGASRWSVCTASPDIEASLPESSSPFAEEGTLAHAVAEALLNGKEPPEHPAEMLDYINTYISQLDIGGNHHIVEHKTDFSEWVPGGFGTADAVIVRGSTLEIHDLKYGKGIMVSATANAQLRLYALGVYSELGFSHDIDQIKMAIHQPRLDHYSEETLSPDELMAFGERIKAAAQETITNPTYRPSPSTCQWCRAKYACKARALQAIEAVEHTLKDTEIAALYQMALLAKSWAADTISHIEALAVDGTPVPGHKLVAGRSVRKWLDNAADILTANGVEPYKPTLKTITDVEKELGKKDAAPILKAATTKPEGNPTLAPAADKRPAITTTSADFPQE